MELGEGLAAREVTFGDVTFRFGKLLAEEGFELFEQLRPGLSPALQKIELTPDLFEGTEEEIKKKVLGFIFRLALQVFATLPPEIVKIAKTPLFRQVTFKSPADKRVLVLAGNTALAFKDLEPIHIYQVIVRAFWVNFRSSFSDLEFLMGSENPTTNQSDTET